MKRRFTLIEVSAALLIIVGGVLVCANMLGSASARSARAESDRAERHMLTQAVEYFLLAAPNTPIPAEFFPYPEYLAEARYRLADERESAQNGWVLAMMTVQLRHHGETVTELEMNRLMRQDEL